MIFIVYFCSFLIFGYIVAVITALLYNKRLKKIGYTGIDWKECFYPSKHFSFLIGYAVSRIPKHIIDQYILRLYDEECVACYESGECLHRHTKKKQCGCDPYKKACSPLEKCSNGNWGTIIFSKKNATKFLKSLNYKIQISYGSQK